MTEGDIVKAVKTALKEHQTEFWIDAEKHYLHHKALDHCQESRPVWEANHEFISAVRRAGSTAKTVTISTVTRTLIAAIFGVIVYAVTHFFTAR